MAKPQANMNFNFDLLDAATIVSLPIAVISQQFVMFHYSFICNEYVVVMRTSRWSKLLP